MKSAVMDIIAIVALLTTGSVLATGMPPIAVRYGCVACHAIDKRVIGPAWMEVSKAYNSNSKTSMGIPIAEILRKKKAEEYLRLKIASGGAGIWGMSIMPPPDPLKVTPADIDALATGIMGLSNGSTQKERLAGLSKLHGCNDCHSLDRKKDNIGPSWMDVSQFYNNSIVSPYDGLKASDVLKSRSAEEWLLFKISHGGRGNWGSKFMPALEYRYLTMLGGVQTDPDHGYPELIEITRFVIDLGKK